MSIQIDFQTVKLLLAEAVADVDQLAGNPGFSFYWRNEKVEPREAAAVLLKQQANFPGSAQLAAARDRFAEQPSTILQSLGRISGASLSQNLSRHLPAGVEVTADVYFVPGGSQPLHYGEGQLAVNLFALEQRANKLHLGEFHLLSVLAHYIHRIATGRLNAGAGGMAGLMNKLLRIGAATLFFTLPTAGPVRDQWDEADEQGAESFALLRRALTGRGDPAQVERSLTLPKPASLAAPYPLATYMCQVIEGAFGRARLVELLQSGDFVQVYEQARAKFGLPDKYSLTPEGGE